LLLEPLLEVVDGSLEISNHLEGLEEVWLLEGVTWDPDAGESQVLQVELLRRGGVRRSDALQDGPALLSSEARGPQDVIGAVQDIKGKILENQVIR